MTSEGVIQGADLKSCHQDTALCRSALPVMKTDLVRERLCSPASHSRREEGNMIYPATLQWRISADLLKALSPKHLASARDILDVNESIVVRGIPVFIGSASYSKPGILGKFAH